MNLNKVLLQNLFSKTIRNISKTQNAKFHNRDQIGNRDWVGYGIHGGVNYKDTLVKPFPAIRFKENTNELLALREKEKGDWRKLTIEEKKILYRASFRQTLVEVLAPTGEWKSILGGVLCVVSMGLWLYIVMKSFLYPERPESFSEENRQKMLRNMLVNRDGFVSGISSKWDYELDTWKK